jgi:hypothetical protein
MCFEIAIACFFLKNWESLAHVLVQKLHLQNLHCEERTKQFPPHTCPHAPLEEALPTSAQASSLLANFWACLLHIMIISLGIGMAIVRKVY